VPIRLNGDWSLITRTKLPAEVLPPKKLGDPWTDGLSNGYTTSFFSPEHGRDLYWGTGAGALLSGNQFTARRDEVRFGDLDPVAA
jgi:hypothetical protein